jgi:hypothetical protein
MDKLQKLEKLHATAVALKDKTKTPRQSKDEDFEFARRLISMRNRGVYLMKALPYLEDFFECRKKWRILGGSNRSTKTQSCALEFARAGMGCDPYDKYVKFNGCAIVVARKEDELANLFKKLTQTDYWVIPDEHTKQWRAVRPDPKHPDRLDPYDDAYREKWVKGPPLLDIKKDVKGKIAWESYSEGVPRKFTFSATGTDTLWLSSNGQPPQGQHFTFAWIDEQLQKDEFFQEIDRGLLQLASEPDHHKPKAFWSATEQTTNLQLDDLRSAASRGEPHVAAFTALATKNPFVNKEALEEWANSLSADEKSYRFDGNSRVGSYAVYRSRFDSQGEQGCEPFVIPEDFCRYIVFDPGSTRQGILFAAVDPEGKHVYIYDGIDYQQCAPSLFAEEVANRQGKTKFEAIVCDKRMGGQRVVSQELGRNAAMPYAEALEEKGVEIRTEGTMAGFHPGCDNISLRATRLQQMMDVRETGPFAGTVRLKVFRGILPELERQIHRAHIDPKTQKRAKIRSDMLDCLEYLAAFDPEYCPPEPIVVQTEEVTKSKLIYEDFLRTTRKKNRRY